MGEYISAPFIHAVGGSWVCPRADIAAGNFDKITALCAEARKSILGFEVAHIGINCADAEDSMVVCEELNKAFQLPVKEGNSLQLCHLCYRSDEGQLFGQNGHIAIRTNVIQCAIAELEKKGFGWIWRPPSIRATR